MKKYIIVLLLVCVFIMQPICLGFGFSSLPLHDGIDVSI